MRKLLVTIVLGGFISLVSGIHFSYASEVDALLQKLIDKGVLNASEAQEIRTETNEDIAKTDKQKLEDYKKLSKDNLPDWVKNTKLTGDFRLRYQWDKDKGLADQSRARIRARLGFITQINNKLEMGVGIATGKASDPRTRNVTLGNDVGATNTPGSAKTVVLDYAYGKYRPIDGVTLIGGKFQNPLWKVHDLFWDDNITPEGVGLQLSRKLNPRLELFMNELVFIMKDDSRTDKIPTLFASQLGTKFNFDNNTSLKAAVTGNLFKGVQGAQKFATASSSANSFNSAGDYMYNYNTIQPALELAFKKPFNGFLPFASLFGEYMYNTSLPSSATGAGGYDMGVKFGNESVSDFNQWQAKFVYSKLGRDSWLDILTNVDRYYPGKANSKAYEAILDYGLGKNTWLRLHYYWAESNTKALVGGYLPEQTLQVDWNMKF